MSVTNEGGCSYVWASNHGSCTCVGHELSEGTNPTVWHTCGECGRLAALERSPNYQDEVDRLRARAAEVAASLPTARFASLRDSLLELAEEARGNDATPASELAQVAQAAALCHMATKWVRDDS